MPNVTIANFVRAETDTYMAGFVHDGAFGCFVHSRALADIADQKVVRMNRDTIYSTGVFDLEAGPLTVALPDSGGRFMSLLAIDEDHYALGTTYGAAPQRFTRASVGTRYLVLIVRTFVDPGDPADLEAAHALQDAIRAEQASPGDFDVPDWDKRTLAATRTAIRAMGDFDPSKAFGIRDEVDPTSHLIGTAEGWGGNPAREATYIAGRPAANGSQTVHRLTVRDVPVDGFWSISVYNQDGYFEPNPQNAYSVNNVTAAQDADGSVTIQFGGCRDGVSNCLPIVPGWNYTVRLYRPRASILDGSWTFPSALPIG
jgi:hypothetical protein